MVARHQPRFDLIKLIRLHVSELCLEIVQVCVIGYLWFAREP